MKEPQLTLYPNAAILRIHNRRIGVFQHKDGGLILSFNNVIPKEDRDKHPPVKHTLNEHGRSVTELAISKEAMEGLIMAYTEHRKATIMDKFKKKDDDDKETT